MNFLARVWQLLLVAVLASLVTSASLGYRLRADKKAMRNSLVRFGKRSDEARTFHAHNAPLAYDLYEWEPRQDGTSEYVLPVGYRRLTEIL
ncbi:hypothetical protein AAVH_00893 [Aphelenchoides avenae]|nr:hypothetical protein AAVH_00893 [Aphelenchus avenae]